VWSVLASHAESPLSGKGLAEHSILPAKLGEWAAAVAENLELHMEALDLSDESSRRERDAYLELAEEHRQIAMQLQTTAWRMAGYRDLPMGRHDPKAMASPRIRAAFEKFVQREQSCSRCFGTKSSRIAACSPPWPVRSRREPERDARALPGVPAMDRLDPASSRS
jgi:hypothetical protein